MLWQKKIALIESSAGIAVACLMLPGALFFRSFHKFVCALKARGALTGRRPIGGCKAYDYFF